MFSQSFEIPDDYSTEIEIPENNSMENVQICHAIIDNNIEVLAPQPPESQHAPMPNINVILPPQTQPERMKPGMKAAIVIISLLILIGAVIGILAGMGLFNKNEQNNSPSANNSQPNDIEPNNNVDNGNTNTNTNTNNNLNNNPGNNPSDNPGDNPENNLGKNPTKNEQNNSPSANNCQPNDIEPNNIVDNGKTYTTTTTTTTD